MTVQSTLPVDWLAAGRAAATAVVDGDRRVGYDELDVAANRVANGLLALAGGGRDRVAYLGRNTLAGVELMIGAPRAGLVVAVLNWRLSGAELGPILEDCRAAVLVVGAEFADLVSGNTDPGMATIVVGGESDEWAAWTAQQDTTRPHVAPRADDVALQLYTSGTTGLPKGVMLTNAGLRDSFADTGRLWRIGESSVLLLVLPLFHIIGIASVLLPLSTGGALVLGNDATVPAIKALVRAYQVTHIVLVSAILEAMSGDGAAGLETLETISYGGAPISEPLLRAVAASIGCRLLQIYGLTETSGSLTALSPEDHEFGAGDERAAGRLRSCGQARPGVELRIVDTNSGLPVAAGQPGEIQARTVRLMLGYWSQPEATREAFTADRWFRTGDIGELDDDGYVYLRDRLKDMIVSGGENVYPAEIERVMSAHPAVADVAVIGVPHERWGETPLAMVVRRPGATTDAAELLAFTRDRLAHYKCPSSVEFVPELPRNATGKVLRRVLREPFWAGRSRHIN